MKKELTAASLARPDILFETFGQRRADGTYVYERLYVSRAVSFGGSVMGLFIGHADGLAELPGYHVIHGETEEIRAIDTADLRAGAVKELRALAALSAETSEMALNEAEYIYFFDDSLKERRHYRIEAFTMGAYDFFEEF